MSIESEIAAHEAALASLRKQLASGYSVKEVTCGEEYYFRDDHELICNMDGGIAGIVLNQKIMTKYFESNPYKVMENVC